MKFWRKCYKIICCVALISVTLIPFSVILTNADTLDGYIVDSSFAPDTRSFFSGDKDLTSLYNVFSTYEYTFNGYSSTRYQIKFDVSNVQVIDAESHVNYFYKIGGQPMDKYDRNYLRFDIFSYKPYRPYGAFSNFRLMFGGREITDSPAVIHLSSSGDYDVNWWCDSYMIDLDQLGGISQEVVFGLFCELPPEIETTFFQTARQWPTSVSAVSYVGRYTDPANNPQYDKPSIDGTDEYLEKEDELNNFVEDNKDAVNSVVDSTLLSPLVTGFRFVGDFWQTLINDIPFLDTVLRYSLAIGFIVFLLNIGGSILKSKGRGG